MTYEVEVSEQADSDLRGIFEYIAFELQSPENASGQLDRLEEQILSLDTKKISKKISTQGLTRLTIRVILQLEQRRTNKGTPIIIKKVKDDWKGVMIYVNA